MRASSSLSRRICTDHTRQTEAFCLGSEVHSQLGLVTFLLCMSFVVAAVVFAILYDFSQKVTTFIPEPTVRSASECMLQGTAVMSQCQ